MQVFIIHFNSSLIINRLKQFLLYFREESDSVTFMNLAY